MPHVVATKANFFFYFPMNLLLELSKSSILTQIKVWIVNCRFYDQSVNIILSSTYTNFPCYVVLHEIVGSS